MFAALNSFLTGALAKVTDVYWPFVSMLLHGDSAQQFNQDTSTNVFPITAVGAVQASTLTPFTGGPSSYGSGYFNGSSYLTTPDNAAFTLGTNDFTVEAWIYATSAAQGAICGQTNAAFANANTSIVFSRLSDGRIDFFAAYNSGSGLEPITTLTAPLNTWTHVAAVRDGATLRVYVGGVQSATASISTGVVNDSASLFAVGRPGDFAGQYFPGYISNFRLVNGTCLYPSGTTFTPPTVQLTAVTNTALLTLQTNVPQNNNQFFDTSTNNFTVTRNGNTTQGSFNPFVSTYPYSVATNGGSAYFDGTGDYLTVPDSTAFTLGSNAFTVECWINISNPSGSGRYIAGQCDSAQSAASTAFGLYISSTSVQFESYSGATYISFGTAISQVVANTWVHLAWVRDTGTNTLRIYVNGVQRATLAIAGATALNNSSSLLALGQNGEAAFTQGLAGYISNFRLVNGTCLYPSGTTFTPPTTPLTAVTNTALLLGMSNGAIYDNAILNNLETVASAQISTSVFKYGTGSMKFNGAGDALVTPNKPLFSFGTGDFTIEMWVYPNSFAGFNTLIDARSVGTASSYGLFTDSSTGKIYWYDASGVQLSSSGLTLNAWAHVAVSRTSGVLKLFIAGVQVYSAANTNAQNPTGNFVIGRNIESSPVYFNGYIDDLRVTKGIGRYTATFTPPDAAFPNQAPTYPSGTATQRAMFGFGENSSGLMSVTNIVSNTGVVAGDTTGVGTTRGYLAASSYGGDKAIFGFGYIGAGTNTAITNLVSNTGVVASDTAGVGTARASPAAARYSTDKAIFGFGAAGATYYSITNLVANTGVVATDTTGVGTTRRYLAATSYGTDKAIFGYGFDSTSTDVSMTNLVSNTGVVASNTTGVGTPRYGLAAAGYGSTGQAIFGYGVDASSFLSMTNLVSNIGVVATDTTGVGTARGSTLAAAGYGGDKAIFGFGQKGSSPFYTAITNLVSNTGVVSADQAALTGTIRSYTAAAGFSFS